MAHYEIGFYSKTELTPDIWKTIHFLEALGTQFFTIYGFNENNLMVVPEQNIAINAIQSIPNIIKEGLNTLMKNFTIEQKKNALKLLDINVYTVDEPMDNDAYYVSDVSSLFISSQSSETRWHELLDDTLTEALRWTT